MKSSLTFINNILVWILLFTAVIAQSQTTKKTDTLDLNLLQEFESKIEKIEIQRDADSIKRLELEIKLSQLNATENQKKEAIQKQLQEIEEKDLKLLEEKKVNIYSLRASAKQFPVLGFFNDTLFAIYSKLGSFSASDRAIAITERVDKIKDIHSFSDSTLKVIESESTFDIVCGELIIISISENDALWNNTTKKELAELYRQIITKAVMAYKKETKITTLLKEFGMALLVVSLLILFIYLVRKLFNWTSRKIQQQEGKTVKGIQIRKYILFDASRLVNFLTTLNNLFKWFIILLLVYIALPIIFGFFPWTQYFAQTLFGYVINPIKKIASEIWNYLPNLFTILVIFVVFRYTIKGIQFLKSEIENGKLALNGFYPDWANPTFQILRVLLYTFMFVIIFPYLPGSDSPVFRGVSVFLGFLFTFGSAGSLSNIVAGVVLTYMRLFKLGDRVKIGEVEGDVIEKSILVTRLKTIKNEIVSIPNSTVMSSHTINYSNEAEQGDGLVIHTTVTIGYDVPWKDMHQALLLAADRTTLLLKEPKPFVLQTSLDDFYISYQINAYTKAPNKQASLYSELHQHIQDCCNEAGIEILSPHYRAIRDGNTSTIPVPPHTKA